MADVKVHYNSDRPAQLQALAYTQGTEIHVAPGQEKHLPHEAWHVVQQKQGRVQPTFQMKGLGVGVNDDPGLEKEADQMGNEAVQFVAPVAQITGNDHQQPLAGQQNQSNRVHPASQKTIQRANSGEHAMLGENDQALAELLRHKRLDNEWLKEAAANPKMKVKIYEDIVVDYGVAMAMGDFFKQPEDMLKMPKNKLKKLIELIQRERQGKPVTEKEWDLATEGRYLKLAEKNAGHFALSNPKLAAKATESGMDQKAVWEKVHLMALQKSRAGLKDEALRINAFADHFLTDAFVTGHLFNKLDVMEQFKKHIGFDKDRVLTRESVEFFDKVAAKTFAGEIEKMLAKSKVSQKAWGELLNHTSQLYQLLYKKSPDIFANLAVKLIHDRLNKEDGIPVENARGDHWLLSGEGKLDNKAASKKTIEIAKKAVAQSQLNVIEVYKQAGQNTGAEDKAKLQKVWNYVPRLTKESEKKIGALILKFTDPKNSQLVEGIANLINLNKKMALEAALGRGKDMAVGKIADMAGTVVGPFGFELDQNAKADGEYVFVSKMNPWQRSVGYFKLYDFATPFAGMFIHCEPIKFNYEATSGNKRYKRFWNIELWKGQYGVATGAEIGLYTGRYQVNTGVKAIDNLINKPHKVNTGIKFIDRTLNKLPQLDLGPDTECAGDDDRLEMEFVLKKDEVELLRRKAKHWWLTGFKPGVVSKPSELTMDIKITMPDPAMREAFVQRLKAMGYRVQGQKNTVEFTFGKPKTEQPLTQRLLSQIVK